MCTRKIILFLLGLFLSGITAWGQRFQKEYHSAIGLLPFAVSETSDSFVIKTTSAGGDLFVDLRIDKEGNNPGFQTLPHVLNLLETGFIRRSDDAVLIFDRTTGQSSLLQYRNPNSTLIWEKTITFIGDPNAFWTYGALFKGVELTDGYLFLGTLIETYAGDIQQHYLYALKTDFSGNVLFTTKKEIPYLIESIDHAKKIGNKIYFDWGPALADPGEDLISDITTDGVWAPEAGYGVEFNEITDFVEHPEGGVIITGFNYGAFTPQENFGRAMSFDENWQIRWQRSGWPELHYLSHFQDGGNYYGEVLASNDNEWVMAGYFTPAGASTNSERNVFLAAFDLAGNNTKLKKFPVSDLTLRTLNKTTDNGYLLSYYYLLNGGHIGVIKTDSNLMAYPNLITGKVFRDQNVSCTFDSTEQHLSGWLVELTGTADTLYTLTNGWGDYEFPADTDAYQVTIEPFNPYWEPCENNVPLFFAAEDLIDTTDFAMQAAIDCPQMEVDVSLPFTRRCFDNTLFVQYCNNGTIAAPTAQVQIVLDPALSYVSSEIPLSGVFGDTLFFNLDSVQVNDCGQFWIKVYVDCDSTSIGQTVCVSAFITPDTFCLPLPFWSGAQVVAGGFCEQDSVVFWLKNTGTSATQILDYVIIEDMVVWLQGNFGPLAPGETDTIKVAANGATYGILADQEPGYPYNLFIPFSNGPSAWVEACNWNGNGLFPGGFITQFPNEDGNPTTSTDCSTLVGSYDPNDKNASPGGVGEEHFILPGTPIEYLIRFQNTGTDTAFTVVIRDDLSTLLDPLSFVLQTSSHPCTLTIEDNDILKFTFNNILLPDSTTNLAGSQGFVKYTIRPRNNAPIGSVINNTAAIFFDFNLPVYTNTYFHTIDTNFIKKTTGITTIPAINPELRLSPNPAQPGTTVVFNGRLDYSGIISLFDISGKKVAGWSMEEGKIPLPKNLPPGLYFIKTGDGWVGKLVVL